MIYFEPLFSFPILVATVTVLLGLWTFQIYHAISNRTNRTGIKILLNSLLYIVLLAFVFQPALLNEEPQETTLVYSPGHRPAQNFIDSLQVEKVTEINSLDQHSKDIILFGQHYSNEELYRLQASQITWIPQKISDEVTALSWEAVRYLGEIQRVKGVVSGSAPKEIRIESFGETIASDEVSDSFEFSFPVLSLGRNELSLIVDDYQVGKIRFFVLPPEPALFQLSFGFPNPEARFLTDYLIKRGENANLRIQITRDGTIAMGNVSENSEPQIIIIDPTQLQTKNIREARDSGLSNFMILNLSNPVQEVEAINSFFGTSFSLEQIIEGTRELDNGISAMGYQFVEKNNQSLFLDKSVSVAYQGDAKVAVSLVEGTFPLAMAGDSSRYAKIWEPLLAELSPIPSIQYGINQPVFSSVHAKVEISVKDSLPEFLPFAGDSLFLIQDPVNPSKAFSNLLADKAGWQVLNDSIELYVNSKEDYHSVYDRELVSSFLRDRRDNVVDPEKIMKMQFIPDWVWLVLVVMILSLVWVEPRV